MSATIATKPPTEAEIRSLLTKLVAGVFWPDAWHEVTEPLFGPAYELSDAPEPSKPREPKEHALWHNLRPSEAQRLFELTEAATDRAEKRCEAVLIEELIAAAIAFADEYPEAPRPR